MAQSADQRDFQTLLQLIGGASDHDLTGHRPEPIEIHVRRRMQAQRIPSLSDYLRLLADSPTELQRLHREILNGVTGFFRDGAPFEMLKSAVFPRLIAHRPAGPVRMWVAGCATGQEAYSLAICWLEFIEALGACVPAQIFATDVDKQGLRTARLGSYSGPSALDVSRERLLRYFTPDDAGYRVTPRVRALVGFEAHDLTRAFRHDELDFVSCRNVLIYLLPSAQRQVLSNLRSSLRPGGRLLLGNSETVGNSPDLFSLIDSSHRLYEAKPSRDERYR